MFNIHNVMYNVTHNERYNVMHALINKIMQNVIFNFLTIGQAILHTAVQSRGNVLEQKNHIKTYYICFHCLLLCFFL